MHERKVQKLFGTLASFLIQLIAKNFTASFVVLSRWIHSLEKKKQRKKMCAQHYENCKLKRVWNKKKRFYCIQFFLVPLYFFSFFHFLLSWDGREISVDVILSGREKKKEVLLAKNYSYMG